jgi:hypothetical protein
MCMRPFFSFQKMQQSQLKPDEVTFLGVLIACSHAGLISEGRNFFDSMSKVYGLMPRIYHYACFIDLLGLLVIFKRLNKLLMSCPSELMV